MKYGQGNFRKLIHIHNITEHRVEFKTCSVTYDII